MTNYPKCRICGQMTKDYYSKQCSACYWSRGRQNFYCSKCKSLISATSTNFGGGLCRKCADKQHSLRMMDKNNPNWKDGRKKLIKGIRDSKRYYHYIYNTFQRDKYTCQICNKTNCHLHVHHKIPITYIIELYQIKTLLDAYNCNLLWDINWGITLCIACHNIIEKSGAKLTKKTETIQVIDLK
jgi:5-methylcytosine-specific restriction endonuclease McrA